MIRILLMLITITYATQSSADMMRMAVTTSFNNSGLSEKLLPAIQADLGLEVQLLIVGTGQAIRLGKAGDVDAILVHSQKAEEAFVAAGYGTHRREIMYNDYILVGPKEDNRKCSSVENKLKEIHDKKFLFISRGDDSGTHRKELEMWLQAKLKIDEKFQWYFSVGQGMGSTLLIANEKKGYALSDRSTWIAFNYKNNLKIV